MTNPKKEFLLKFVKGIENDAIIDVLDDMLDAKAFKEEVESATGLMPVWVVISIHISMQGNRYRTGIEKAFKTKKGLTNYIYARAMSGNKSAFETDIFFIKSGSNNLFYTKTRNNLNYYNYQRYYPNEEEARLAETEATDVENVELQ